MESGGKERGRGKGGGHRLPGFASFAQVDPVVLVPKRVRPPTHPFRFGNVRPPTLAAPALRRMASPACGAAPQARKKFTCCMLTRGAKGSQLRQTDGAREHFCLLLRALPLLRLLRCDRTKMCVADGILEEARPTTPQYY